MTCNCLAKLALHEIENSNDNSSDWKSSIKRLLKQMSLENVYPDPQTYGVNQLNTLCKTKMRSTFTEFWNSELSMADIGSVRNSKLRTYKQFKNKFALENYLIVTPSFKSRKFITKFRCSDDELMIEKRRHKKIYAEKKLSSLCSEKREENELHFLLESPASNRVRIGITNFYKNSSPQHISERFAVLIQKYTEDFAQI